MGTNTTQGEGESNMIPAYLQVVEILDFSHLEICWSLHKWEAFLFVSRFPSIPSLGPSPKLSKWNDFCCPSVTMTTMSKHSQGSCHMRQLAFVHNESQPSQHIPTQSSWRNQKQSMFGGFNPSEKYARQIRSFPEVGVKITNIWVATT